MVCGLFEIFGCNKRDYGAWPRSCRCHRRAGRWSSTTGEEPEPQEPAGDELHPPQHDAEMAETAGEQDLQAAAAEGASDYEQEATTLDAADPDYVCTLTPLMFFTLLDELRRRQKEQEGHRLDADVRQSASGSETCSGLVDTQQPAAALIGSGAPADRPTTPEPEAKLDTPERVLRTPDAADVADHYVSVPYVTDNFGRDSVTAFVLCTGDFTTEPKAGDHLLFVAGVPFDVDLVAVWTGLTQSDLAAFEGLAEAMGSNHAPALAWVRQCVEADEDTRFVLVTFRPIKTEAQSWLIDYRQSPAWSDESLRAGFLQSINCQVQASQDFLWRAAFLRWKLVHGLSYTAFLDRRQYSVAPPVEVQVPKAAALRTEPSEAVSDAASADVPRGKDGQPLNRAQILSRAFHALEEARRTQAPLADIQSLEAAYTSLKLRTLTSQVINATPPVEESTATGSRQQPEPDRRDSATAEDAGASPLLPDRAEAQHCGAERLFGAEILFLVEHLVGLIGDRNSLDLHCHSIRSCASLTMDEHLHQA